MNDYGVCRPSGASYSADFAKDPDSTTDFAFDWAGDLDGDTLSASVFVLPDGLTQVSTLMAESRTAIFVSGGECGRVYRIVNRVTTVGGRTWDKTIYIKITEQ